MTNPRLLRKYANRFGLTYTEFEVLETKYLGFHQVNASFAKPLRQKFIDWILADPGNLLRAAFHPIDLDGAIIVIADRMNSLLDPSVVPVGRKSLVFVSEGLQKMVTRGDVKGVFSKILRVSCQAKLSSLGTTQFGQPHLPESTKGIVDAIRDFDGDFPREIRLFEVNPTIDRRIFSYIEAELT